MTDALLSVKDLVVRRGAVEIVHGCSLQVASGERVLLTGHNGAGKSTLVSAIFGLLRPLRGQVLLDGHLLPPANCRKSVLRGLVMVPQGGGILRGLAVADNLAIAAAAGGLTGAKIASEVDHKLTMFPLLRERRGQLAGTLSGGEQRVLAIARAEMLRPRLLIIDEPLLGLAVGIAKLVLETIDQLQCARDLSVLLVEHQIKTLEGHFDRGYVMRQGRIANEVSHDEMVDPDKLWTYA